MAKTCAICGKPSGMYPLCPACFKLRDAGEIEKCEYCGSWHRKNELCECIVPDPVKKTKKQSKAESVKEAVQQNAEELTCILCGEPSNGKHFCVSCYHEYKNRSVDIRLKNLKFEMILDDYGNLKYKCEDGRYVRSLQEQSIANTLWGLDIKYVYEEKVYYYTDEENAKSISPDFYLPKPNLYIEHIGFTSKKHDSITQYKQKIYDEQGKKVIFTSPENLQDFKAFIKKTLKLN